MTESQAPEGGPALTDEQIDALMPRPDGTAEINKRPIDGWAGAVMYDFDEVEAWSRPLVRAAVRAALAAQHQARVALTDAQLEHEWRHFNAPVDNPISLFDFECVAIAVQEALGIRAPQTKEQP